MRPRMPRRARSLQVGEYYHVLNRASLRATLFFTQSDYRAFMTLLHETVRRHRLPLVSYCLMPNHWHLVVRPLNHTVLSTSMHWLTCTHAVRWCKAHVRTGCGPLYQGRFKSIPVEPDFHLLRLCRYVERNASHAKFCPRAEDWPWSSAYQRVKKQPRPGLMPLPFFEHDSWLRFVNGAEFDPAVAEAIRKSRPFGSEEWARDRIDLQRLSPSGALGRPRMNK